MRGNDRIQTPRKNNADFFVAPTEILMVEDNKRNLQYFEAQSMNQLYDCMNAWQEENRKRLLSLSIHADDGKFCCIALTNPTEVILCAGDGWGQATVSSGALCVFVGQP